MIDLYEVVELEPASENVFNWRNLVRVRDAPAVTARPA